MGEQVSHVVRLRYLLLTLAENTTRERHSAAWWSAGSLREQMCSSALELLLVSKLRYKSRLGAATE